MNDLLAMAIESHGGLDRWNSFQKLRVKISIDGAIWYVKQAPGLLHEKVFELDTQSEKISISPFGIAAGQSLFADDILSFENEVGKVLSSWIDPSSLFAGQTIQTPWDLQHVAYFASEALWTYLTSPFLFAYPGFVTREIEPWNEGGETWRRLEVIFPDYIASHTKTQVVHFGVDGLMRRHDYTVDILGGASGANYPGAYRDFQGIKLPTTRRIFAYDSEMKSIPEPMLVSVDISDAAFF